MYKADSSRKAFAASTLQQFRQIDIQAQKQLFILDACQSAGAFEAMISSDANQQKSIAVVAPQLRGRNWLAASGAQQFANEFSSWSWRFTYVLLSGCAERRCLVIT